MEDLVSVSALFSRGMERDVRVRFAQKEERIGLHLLSWNDIIIIAIVVWGEVRKWLTDMRLYVRKSLDIPSLGGQGSCCCQCLVLGNHLRTRKVRRFCSERLNYFHQFACG